MLGGGQESELLTRVRITDGCICIYILTKANQDIQVERTFKMRRETRFVFPL